MAAREPACKRARKTSPEGARSPANEQMPRVLGAVDVPGDGNCLFSALALHEPSSTAEELRTEVADFLEANAMTQGAHAESWLEESDYLRGSKEDHWGGDTALVAYSLLRQRRIFVHTQEHEGSQPKVVEKTHQGVAVDVSADAAIHLLYNGSDDYTGLVQIEDLTYMEEAWPQPPPPKYFKATAQASVIAAAPLVTGAMSQSVITEKQATPDFSAKKRKSAVLQDPVPGSSSSARALASCQGAANYGSGVGSKHNSKNPRRRLSGKIVPPPEWQENLLEEVCQTRVAKVSLHPKRKLEEAIQGLATRLRASPTIPPGCSMEEWGRGTPATPERGSRGRLRARRCLPHQAR